MQNRKDAFSPIPLVQKDAKKLPYTVSVIGGPELIQAHREMVAKGVTLAAEESARKWQIQRSAIISMVEEQVSALHLTAAEKEEVRVMAMRIAKEQLIKQQSTRSHIFLKTLATETECSPPQPPVSFIARCKDWLSNLWTGANFSK